MSATQHLYETTFIINASLEDPRIEGVNGRVQEVITKNKGEIKALDKWGRKRLAYPIKKKNNGFYVSIEYSGTGVINKHLEQMYLLDEHVIRFLTIRIDEKALKARELAPVVKAVEDIPILDEVVEVGKAPLFEDDEEAPAV